MPDRSTDAAASVTPGTPGARRTAGTSKSPDPAGPSAQPSLSDLAARQYDLDRQRAALLALRAELDATAAKLAREQARVEQLHSHGTAHGIRVVPTASDAHAPDDTAAPLATDEPTPEIANQFDTGDTGDRLSTDPLVEERAALDRERATLAALRDELTRERVDLDRRARDLDSKVSLFKEKRTELLALREDTHQRQEQVDALERKMAEIWAQLEMQNTELETGKQQLRDGQAQLARASESLEQERIRLTTFEQSLLGRHTDLNARAAELDSRLASAADAALRQTPAPSSPPTLSQRDHADRPPRQEPVEGAEGRREGISNVDESHSTQPVTANKTDDDPIPSPAFIPDSLATSIADSISDDEDIDVDDADESDEPVPSEVASALGDASPSDASLDVPIAASTPGPLRAPIAAAPSADASPEAIPPLHLPTTTAPPGPHPLTIFVLMFRVAMAILALVAIGFASWYAAQQLAPPTWRATVDIVLGPTTMPAPSAASAAPVVASTDWTVDARALLLSDPVLRDAFANLARTGPSPFDSPQSLRPALQQSLTLIPRDDATREFQLAYTDTDRELARRVLEALARAVVALPGNDPAARAPAAFWDPRPVRDDRTKVAAELFAAGAVALLLILFLTAWLHRRSVGHGLRTANPS